MLVDKRSVQLHIDDGVPEHVVQALVESWERTFVRVADVLEGALANHPALGLRVVIE